MTQDEIRNFISQALSGSRKGRIKFKQEATGEVQYLLAMVRDGGIEISKGDKLVLECVSMYRDWDNDRNRTLTITLTDRFDTEQFVGRMWRALESIQAAA